MDLVENLRLAPRFTLADAQCFNALLVTVPGVQHGGQQGAKVGKAAHGRGVVATGASGNSDKTEHAFTEQQREAKAYRQRSAQWWRCRSEGAGGLRLSMKFRPGSVAGE